MVALDRYYGQVWEDQSIPVYVPLKPHPRVFPYPTKFNERPTEADTTPEYIEFEYIDALRADPTNVTFLAKVKSSDKKLVIKFVDRYGVEAHQLLAVEKMAPQLLYCGLLDGKSDVRDAGDHAQGSIGRGGLYLGPMRMVITEHIKGNTADEVSTWPNGAREEIKKAIQKLHDAQLVFGDLRGPNIMFSENRVFLIDFDWAGRVNEARYPRHLSGRVAWPGDVEELEMKPILMDHDLTMLERLFSQ